MHQICINIDLFIIFYYISLLPIAYCLLPIAYCLLPIAYCWYFFWYFFLQNAWVCKIMMRAYVVIRMGFKRSRL